MPRLLATVMTALIPTAPKTFARSPARAASFLLFFLPSFTCFAWPPAGSAPSPHRYLSLDARWPPSLPPRNSHSLPALLPLGSSKTNIRHHHEIFSFVMCFSNYFVFLYFVQYPSPTAQGTPARLLCCSWGLMGCRMCNVPVPISNS